MRAGLQPTVVAVMLLALSATSVHASEVADVAEVVRHAEDASPTRVTAYGVISTAVRYTNNVDGARRDLLELTLGGIGGSRVGFKGEEDLGGGRKAVFQFENGFNTDTGVLSRNGVLFNRQSYVGLSDPRWGSLSVGRQYNALNNVGWTFNPIGQGWGNFLSDPFYLGGDVFFQDYRLDNSVVYQRTDGPMTLQLDYGFGEQAGNLRNGRTIGGGVLYQQGGIALGASAERSYRADGRAADNWTWGASTVYGDVTFYLGHMGRREQAGSVRYALYFIGSGYRLSSKWHASAAYYRYRQSGAVMRLGSDGDGDGGGSAAARLLGGGSANAVTALLEYALSKRTSVYLEMDAVAARDGAVGRETEYWSGRAASAPSTTRVGAMLGIRHMF